MGRSAATLPPKRAGYEAGDTLPYRPPEGYLTVEQARQRLGVARATMTRLIRTGAIPTYADPINLKVKLIKESELAEFRQPRRLGTEGEP